jgi:DNA invertase Pin-like site-specific DNA recombinase
MQENSRAYVYIRFSTKKQKEGDSIRRQTEGLEHFKRAYPDVEIKETFSDEGVSAFNGKNLKEGELLKIDNMIENGVIRKGDYIIVESIDRLTRTQILDSITLVAGWMRKGVRLYTTSDRWIYDYENEDLRQRYAGINYFITVAQRAHEESVMKQLRSRENWKNKRENIMENLKQGKPHTRSLPLWINFNEVTKKFEIVDDIASDIRTIFKYLELYGMHIAIQKLNTNGEKKSNHLFKRNFVNKLTNDKRLFGTYTVSETTQDDNTGNRKATKEIEVPNYFPPIMTEKYFRQVRKIIESRIRWKEGKEVNKQAGNVSKNDVNVFRIITHCGHCNQKMQMTPDYNTLSDGTKVKYKYLKCAGRKMHICDAPQIRYDDLLEAFVAFFEIFKLENIFQTMTNEKIKKMEIDHESAITALSKVENEQKNYNKMLKAYGEQGLEIPDSFMTESVKVAKKLTEAKKKAEEIEQEIIIEKQNNSVILEKEELTQALESNEKRLKLNNYLKGLGVKLYVVQTEARVYIVCENMKNDFLSEENEVNDRIFEKAIQQYFDLNSMSIENELTKKEAIQLYSNVKKAHQEALSESNVSLFLYEKYVFRKYGMQRERVELDESATAPSEVDRYIQYNVENFLLDMSVNSFLDNDITVLCDEVKGLKEELEKINIYTTIKKEFEKIKKTCY